VESSPSQRRRADGADWRSGLLAANRAVGSADDDRCAVTCGVGFFPHSLRRTGGVAGSGRRTGAPHSRLFRGTTLAFAVATVSWLLSRSFFLHGDALITMPRAVVGSLSFASQRTYYALCLIALVIVIVVVSRLRKSGFGRSLIAVRDNQRALSATGISPTRVKLTAFAISGAIAGLAGGLLAGLYVTFGPDRFGATESLQAIAIVVIGGLGSVTGAVLGALFVVGIPVLFSNSPNARAADRRRGILVVILFFPADSPRSCTRSATSAPRGWRRYPSPRFEPRRDTSRAADTRRGHGLVDGERDRDAGLRAHGSFRTHIAVDAVDLSVGRGDRRVDRFERRREVDDHECHRRIRPEPGHGRDPRARRGRYDSRPPRAARSRSDVSGRRALR
jgi:hypothetical protein